MNCDSGCVATKENKNVSNCGSVLSLRGVVGAETESQRRQISSDYVAGSDSRLTVVGSVSLTTNSDPPPD